MTSFTWWLSRLFAPICLLLVLTPIAGAKNETKSANGDQTEAAKLFSDTLIPRIQIEIPSEGIQVLRDYNQVWGKPRPERIDVHATIREGGRVYTNILLHLKGSYSYQPIDGKPSFTLNFEKEAPGQKFHGLPKMHLNNSVQDPTYLSEKFARDLFREAGVPSPRIGYAFVELNGRQLGFYALAESWGKAFLKQHFSSASGNLYDGGSGGDITKALKVDSGENPDDRTDLTNLVKACRIKMPSERQARLAQLLNLDQLLSFVATEVFIVHWDGYSIGGPNNYRVFHDTARDKMVFMPHGLDQTFGVSSSTELSITPHLNGLAAKAVLSIPEQRQRYFSRVRQLAENQFSSEQLRARLDMMARRLQKALVSEPQIWERIESALEAMRERINRRCASVLNQLQHPPGPVSFGPDNEIALKTWRFKSANTRPASGRRSREDGKDLLQVVARNGDSTGSWRVTMLLESGLYELSGDARVQGLGDAKGTNGVILRASGERSTEGISTSTDWKHFTYDFEVHGIEDVELVCEYRGPRGQGEFDLGTLRLRRKQALKEN